MGMKLGGEITGDGEGTEEERKGIGIRPTRGLLQLFSRSCPMGTSRLPRDRLTVMNVRDDKLEIR